MMAALISMATPSDSAVSLRATRIAMSRASAGRCGRVRPASPNASRGCAASASRPGCPARSGSPADRAAPPVRATPCATSIQAGLALNSKNTNDAATMASSTAMTRSWRSALPRVSASTAKVPTPVTATPPAGAGRTAGAARWRRRPARPARSREWRPRRPAAALAMRGEVARGQGGQIPARGQRQPRHQHLEAQGQQRGCDDHRQQAVAEAAAAGDVGGPVARVDVADGDQQARADHAPHAGGQLGVLRQADLPPDIATMSPVMNHS